MLRYIRSAVSKIARSRRVSRRSILRRLGIGGFTLLELFIVVEIIAFLTTIVISNYYRSKKAAQVAVVVQNLKNVQLALTSYFAMEGKYPDTLNPIWLQFYSGRIVENFDYIGGNTSGNQGGWNFFPSNSLDIRFNGIKADEYAIKSTQSYLPYALYIYGDIATSAKIVH
ncbi:MAG: type II secretion system protein [bacterium]|nr:MAG: type II secretion system protein [bacterium]